MITKTDIEKYFNAERGESVVFLAIGFVGIIIGIYFLWQKNESFLNGVAIPLIVIGLLLGVVGYSVFARSPKDIERVTAMIGNKTLIEKEEIPRMKAVMKNFILYRYVEIALALIGIGLIFAFANQPFWKGLGVGLLIMSVLALAADYFAEKRGKQYTQQL